MWRLRGGQLQPGYPAQASRHWQGLPSPVDAAFEDAQGHIWFFQGEWGLGVIFPGARNVMPKGRDRQTYDGQVEDAPNPQGQERTRLIPLGTARETPGGGGYPGGKAFCNGPRLGLQLRGGEMTHLRAQLGKGRTGI